MSAYKPGDVVELNRAKVYRATVTGGPLAPGEAYALTLPINGEPKEFVVHADPPDDAEVVATLLEALLANEQTVYSVLVDPDAPTTLVVVGIPGESWEATVAGQLELAVEQEEILTTSPDGTKTRPCQVVASENNFRLETGPREYWTRVEPTGVLLSRNRLRLRELDTGRFFEVDASEVMGVLLRASGD